MWCENALKEGIKIEQIIGDVLTKEQNKLVEENHNLIYSFLHKYHLNVDDYYGLAAIGLCRAGMTYKGDKSCFSTYAYKCMFTSIFAEKRKNKTMKRIPEHSIIYYQAEIESDDGKGTSIMNAIPSQEDVEENVLSKVVTEKYIEKLEDRDKKVITLFKQGYKQREICKIVGCSQPHVSRIKKKLLQHLLDLKP